MANMKYPSSFTSGSSAGAISVSNLTNFQELKDITVGFGAGTGDTTVASYNSRAKYPTDVVIGGPTRTNSISQIGAALGSSSVTDLTLAFSNFVTAKDAVLTELNNMTATELLVSPNLATLTFNNIQSKIEKVTFEVNRLADDLLRVDAGTAGGALKTPVGRYPSSRNRFTNTDGGI